MVPVKNGLGARAWFFPGAGDSYTYGVLVVGEKSDPSRLRARFADAGTMVTVANGGIPGQNTSELCRVLAELLVGFLASDRIS